MTTAMLMMGTMVQVAAAEVAAEVSAATAQRHRQQKRAEVAAIRRSLGLGDGASGAQVLTELMLKHLRLTREPDAAAAASKPPPPLPAPLPAPHGG